MELRLGRKKIPPVVAALMVAALVIFPFLAYFEIKLAIGCTAAMFLLAGVIHRRRIGQEVVVAALFALFVTSYQSYVYTSGNALLGHINLFPLVSWTAGLVLLREVYERLTIPYPLLSASALYLLLLFAVEYVGYYLLNIRIAENDPSLLGLGIIHGPPFIHFFYVFAGPVYLLVTDYLRVK